MQLLHQFDNTAGYRGGIVSIGNFDGVHRGHKKLISVLVERAKQLGVPAIVFTFDPHPIAILSPEHTPPCLSTIERKAELLGQCGVDYLIAYPTDVPLLKLTPQQFYQQIISEQLDAKGLVEGPNFFFGRDRAGNIETLKQLSAEDQREVNIVEPTSDGDEMISSSRVRHRIVAGEIKEAIEMLGHPYRITGQVAAGEGRGRTLGFPTANLHEIETLLPENGVYAAVGEVDGKRYPAAVNIGSNPTFSETACKFEAHLIGCNDDLYGKTIHVDLLNRLRDIIPFSDAESLQAQLEQDIQSTEEFVSQSSYLN